QVAGLQGLFEEKVAQSSVTGIYRTADTATPSWTVLYAHYADLVVASQHHEMMLPAVPEEVLLSAGVPMLILPQNWTPAPVGDSVLVAWNASREATRAIHDAMPILVRARKATLFSYNPHVDRKHSDP